MVNFLNKSMEIFSGLLFRLVNIFMFILGICILIVFVCSLIVTFTDVTTNVMTGLVYSALDFLRKLITDLL